MVTIVRGTTPSYIVDLSSIPEYPDFDVSTITSVSLIFKRGNQKTEKGLSDMIINGSTLSYHFSQEETLAFTAGEIIKVDMHIVASGERYKVCGIPDRIMVENTDKNEVMY